MWTIVLLALSNVFMTLAWYGHLTGKKFLGWTLPSVHDPLAKVIIVSWGLAFFEYCLQVPANRLGAAQFSFAQLKTLQECITLVVFALFAIFFLGETLKWNHWVGFSFLGAAAFFIFKK